MAISARSALLILVGLIPLAFAPSRSFAWMWFCLVVAVCLLDALGAPSPRTLRLSREVTGPIRADQTTKATLRLTNTTKRHMLLDVRDAWPPSLRPSPCRQRVRLRPGEGVRISTTLAPTRRGTRHADVVTVRSWGPLHLGARQVSFGAPLSLSALPEFKARVLLPARLARLHELEGTTPTTLRGAGTEFDSLRAYVIGDDPRDIDWRASARSTELMVRQWRPERDRHVVIVVDCGRASSALLGAPEHEEVDSIALGRAPPTGFLHRDGAAPGSPGGPSGRQSTRPGSRFPCARTRVGRARREGHRDSGPRVHGHLTAPGRHRLVRGDPCR